MAWPTNPMWLASLYKGELWNPTHTHTNTHAQGENAVWRWVERSVMLPHTKGCQRLPANHQKPGERPRQLPLPSCGRNQPCWHLDLASRLWNNKCLLFKPAGLWCIFTACKLVIHVVCPVYTGWFIRSFLYQTRSETLPCLKRSAHFFCAFSFPTCKTGN